MADLLLFIPMIGESDEIISIDFANNELPLHILSICRFIHEDYDIKIIDQRVDNNWKKLLDMELKKNPLCFGITSLTGKQIEYKLEVCRFVKENSNVPIVLGGVHGSLLPDDTIKEDVIDIVVKGEGEITFKELIEVIKNKKELKNIKGIIYKKKGEIIQNQDREFIDMNELPVLPLHLLDIKTYSKALPFETSRGCPFNCTFCYNHIFNKHKYRQMKANKVIKEIKDNIKKYKFEKLHFIDDNFFIDFERTKYIINEIRKQYPEIKWNSEGLRVDTTLNNQEIIDFLVNTGCKRISIGAESGSDKTLKKINKGISVKDTLYLNRLLSKKDIYVAYNIMIGFPFETKRDFAKTCLFAYKIIKNNKRAKLNFISIFQPWPGTLIYSRCINNKDFKEPSNIKDWAKINWQCSNLECFNKKIKELLRRIHIVSFGLRITKSSKKKI